MQQQQGHHRSHLCINTSRNAAGLSTLSPGHEAILLAHADSQWNAAVYVAIVLFLYALALIVVTVQRARSERSQVRLALLYHSFWRRNSSSKQKAQQPQNNAEEREEETARVLNVPTPVSPTQKTFNDAESIV